MSTDAIPAAREVVHRAYRAAMARGASGTLIPSCATHDNGYHAWVCDEMTSAIEHERLMVKNGHRRTPAAPSEPPELVRLREENANQKRQLTHQQARNHERNVDLDALHYVWCNGGCKGGVHRFTPGPVTEEVVVAAERNTKRLRTWWINRQARDARAATPGTAPAPREVHEAIQNAPHDGEPYRQARAAIKAGAGTPRGDGE